MSYQAPDSFTAREKLEKGGQREGDGVTKGDGVTEGERWSHRGREAESRREMKSQRERDGVTDGSGDKERAEVNGERERTKQMARGSRNVAGEIKCPRVGRDDAFFPAGDS